MKKNLPMATRNSDLREQSQQQPKVPASLKEFAALPRQEKAAWVLTGVSILLAAMIALVVLYAATVGVMNLDVIMAPAPHP